MQPKHPWLRKCIQKLEKSPQIKTKTTIEPFLESTIADGLLTIYTPHKKLQYIVEIKAPISLETLDSSINYLKYLKKKLSNDQRTHIITVLLKSPNEEDKQRVYDQVIDEITEARFEVDEAAIIFIGKNFQNKLKSETLNAVKEIIELIVSFQDKYIPQFVPKNLEEQEGDEAFDKIVKRFESWQYGLTNFYR